MNLYDLTRDLHHKAERHPCGKAMADGSISAEGWADWLGALCTIHLCLDPHMDTALHRVNQIATDMHKHGVSPKPITAAYRLAGYIDSETANGVGYIFAGAHLRGGAVIRRRMPWPCSHLTFTDARAADVAVKALREDVTAAEAARHTFEAIIAIMDEVRA